MMVPSYYALEMYRDRNARDAGQFLTRFETKNGLSKALGARRPWPLGGVGLGNKASFATYCRQQGIPCPQTLVSVHDGEVDWFCSKAELNQDLFCKKQTGAGAEHTLSFRCIGNELYRGSDGQELSLASLLGILRNAPRGVCYLVQPWLRNHPSISDFAVDSLVAIRVVTCLNQAGNPEVTLAMLRVLAKLEPSWSGLPDEEYATPIDLITGQMGLLTGDHMKTSLLRYEKHVVTGRQVNGRVLEEWPAVRDLAIRAHQIFPQFVLVGWDIALTDTGPIVLEGNPNLDVMFLQRVHDLPTGRTRMGELMNYHLSELESARLAQR